MKKKKKLTFLMGGARERERERSMIFPLGVSGPLVCDMSPSVGTSCLSPLICFSPLSSRHPLHCHPLLFLHSSLPQCLAVAQPCCISLFSSPHTHSPATRKHTAHLSCAHCKSVQMYSSVNNIYLSLRSRSV